ncbi:MAG TPA: phosphatase PAP2 family protein [Pseudolabrys sp.]|nr:phosphatase PAP2 family protein [Pseudolabrys sp.]
MSRTGLIVIVSIALCAGLTLALFPFIDFWVAKTLSDSTLASSPMMPVVRNFGLWIELLFIAFSFVALAIKLFFPRSKMLMPGRAVVFLIATLALGPGLLVNVALKDNWGRPRPGHLKQFGGDQNFVAWWDPTGPCEKNCSFVSGEASAAFWTIAPAALAPPEWRALAYTAAIAFGVIISASRMIMGAHFLSDAIFSGVFTFLIIWLVYALIYRWPRTRLDEEAMQKALARFSIYCRTAIGRLLRY